jgi:hypothetical protein
MNIAAFIEIPKRLADEKGVRRFANRYLLPWGGCLLALLLMHHALASDVLAQCSGPSGSCSEAGLEEDLIRNAVGNLFMLIEGAFGALIMVVAGLGAIVASAMGAYRAAVGMLVVAVGAFILRALVSLFFGVDYASYEV